jgi:hypothetical protein
MRRNVPLKHEAVVGEIVIRWSAGTKKANRRFDYENESTFYVGLSKRLRVDATTWRAKFLCILRAFTRVLARRGLDVAKTRWQVPRDLALAGLGDAT